MKTKKLFIGLLIITSMVGLKAHANAATSFNQKFDNMVAKEIILKRIQYTNERNFKQWEKLHTPHACRTAPAFKGELCGAGEMSQALQDLIVSFPDYKLELVEVYRSNKNMFAKIRAKGTFKHPLNLGDGNIIPATGKTFTQEWVANIRLNTSAKIERFEEFYDQYDLLLQLGIL